ncbi:MAG: extracellular solute-binding protein, partial [Chloroflexota bacterium]
TKEGEIIYDVTRSTSGAQKRTVPDFEAAFPGIKVTQTTSDSAAVFAQKVLQEQNGGIFSWDLLFMSQAPFQSLMPVGALAPLRPLIIHPDALADSAWIGGFEAGWNDNDKKWGYTANLNLGPQPWVNTSMVGEGEIKTVADLLNPKWQGKICWSDPRVNGYGYGPLVPYRITKGDAAFRDFLIKLVEQQKAALNRDTRQITEWMVRGNYAIGAGVVPPVLAEFQAQGLGKNLKQLALDEFRFGASNKPVWLPKQVPHPNAAKLFLNWWLTKPGQLAWSDGAQVNSRRKDIPVFDKDAYVEPNKPVPYVLDTENGSIESAKTVEMAKDLIK